MSERKVDFLVIGSGIAGLSFALKAADHGKVLIVTKSNEDESNTKYAQGGVAAVVDKSDSFEQHIVDTQIAGDGLCDVEIVENVVREAPERINELISYGTSFDKSDAGVYDLAKEGGHSAHRILHYKDITGYEIERSLLQKIHEHPNIEMLTHYFAIDLITQHHLGEFVDKQREDIKCYGIYAFNTNTHQVDKILSKITVMASGGAGHIYASTTNPTIATGDGIAMVYRAKGKVRNMEFMQFHPTSLYNPSDSPAFLVSEAVRGFGGILRRVNGEDFMKEYDERASLAPRDIVARAIDSEMKKSGIDYVYLDITHREKADIIKHFPNIYEKCLSIGLDMSKDFIPVTPAAHYLCGGIYVDDYGRSSISNLYACGECSSTGLHGANRLASNSLLEALVYAHRIYLDSSKSVSDAEYAVGVPEWDDSKAKLSNEDILVTHNLRECQKVMSDYVGIVRSDFRLERALNRLHLLYGETEDFYRHTKLSVKLCELRNVIQVAFIVTKSALLRKESRGLHFTTDYPHHADTLKDTIF
ncbi:MULTISPECIES: L-aspartate oxidase [Sphingobacterium]|uniref:L-aspartate oxidase n=1 Tax=Sphingobacterium TaxID=28453 RepID=UPI0004E5FCF5|nr:MULTISPECIES: L-aspartate oxidase [Sphingobacterium]CDT18135.1 L-aspartate oxidase [Sphingobacterium sp. PM2-P1-29]SJN32278.1 L-aspartate oxidase [Sphingobacterium faecium PCAi_F2.5]HCU44769.1 L-aspartate oxidase [Sphingobacterium sp.]UPZ37606.1 L-aspartate oxidase [Sphingobacterium sp. PCS056]UXD69096.1 L-aspartate oxidase [Sphingobacterium faecium]